MNSLQKKILLVGATLLIIVSIFPPFIEEAILRPGAKQFLGHFFIFDHVKATTSGRFTNIDTWVLAIDIAVISLVSTILFFVASKLEHEKEIVIRFDYDISDFRALIGLLARYVAGLCVLFAMIALAISMFQPGYNFRSEQTNSKTSGKYLHKTEQSEHLIDCKEVLKKDRPEISFEEFVECQASNILAKKYPNQNNKELNDPKKLLDCPEILSKDKSQRSFEEFAKCQGQ